MHEMSVVINTVNMAEEYARKNGASKITKIVLEIGEFHSVVPEYIRYFFPDVVEGTMLEGAQLEIETVTGMARCRNCGAEYPWKKSNYRCPDCGSEECKIISGRDFVIKEISVQ
ncbi:MAG TPA: hydrogenase maturation nickel metallochaperone HypA [Firmicutes bacterium]|nr:hydrogenase maturation nickel metallochaperone HypA [Bacillota bacterium]